METKLLIALLASVTALITSFIASFFSFKANKKLGLIQKDKQILDVLTSQMQQLKEVTDKLNGITGYVWNPEESKESQAKDFIDKTVNDYNTVVDLFKKNQFLIDDDMSAQLQVKLETINQNLYTLDNSNKFEILRDGTAWANECIRIFNEAYSKLNRKLIKTAYNKK